MKQSLSSLNFILKADISQFQTALRSASTQLKRTGDSFKNMGANMGMYVTAPIAAATTAMLLLTNRSAQFADSIDEMSDRTGIAKSTLQELSYVAGQIGIDFPAMEKAMARLNKTMGDAANGGDRQAEVFEKLGIQITDNEGQLRSMSDIFPEVVGALSRMSNETERNYTTMELFGRGANAVITPLTELGEEGLQQMIDRAHELGVVMSDEGIRSLAEYADAMESMKDQVAAVGREMSIGFAKLMTDTILPLLQDKIIPAIKSLGQWFSNLSPGVKSAILVFTALAAAISPVMLTIGVMSSSVIPGLLMAIRGLTVAFTWLTGVIAANPIGAFAVFITAAATALGLFRTRTKEAADAQHKLGQEIKGVNEEVGKQIWEQLGGLSAKKMTDGTYQIIDSFDQLKEKVASLTKGELMSLKAFLENEYSNVTRLAANETSELKKTLYADDLNRITTALGILDTELVKFAEITRTVAAETKTLEETIDALEDQLWKEVQANDANAVSTARLLAVKKQELDYYKEKQKLLLDIGRMESIKPSQTQVSTAVMGPPESDILFEKETKQLTTFNEALRETAAVAIDISNLVASALSDLAAIVGESLGQLMAGTFDMKNVFEGFIGIIAKFCMQLGEMLIGIGTAKLVLDTLGSVSPYVALAAGIALVALGSMASSFMSSGIDTSNGGSASGWENSMNTDLPGAASGAIVTRPTILMAGEGGESEAILPISGLMNTIYNAISSNNISRSMSMSPITVRVQVEGKLKAGEMYLMNKTYENKLVSLK